MSSMSSIPNEELPILEALINIRNRLTALKKDSSEFIRSHDVQQIYQQVIKQITRLNTVRDELQANSQAASATSSSSDHQEQSDHADGRNSDDSPIFQTNRVDTTLNDVFSLLSLFFLTIGRSKESPATFSQLSCMKQLLDHLQESGVYTEADLQPFGSRLAELREIIRRDGDGGRHPPQLTKLMTRKFEACEKTLRKLEGTLKVLSVELVPIHQKIINIRRQLAAAAAKPKPARAEIKQLQEELRKIDAKRVDGKFLGPGGSSVPAGQAILVGLLEECFEICHDITVRNDEVPMTLQPIYDRLVEIKSQLEHLVLTHRWTLRETDLWNYQVTLKEIDRLRIDGKFVDSEGKQPEGQLVLLYLLRRCYGLIYRLVASSEPISEELMPISNKLSTVSKCLKEVSKYGGPFTMRDLYPYRLALHQIDNMRSKMLDKDGTDTGVRKWLGRDGSVPEGQAILRAQYEEVEQTIEEMLNREDDDDDEDDGEIWEGSTASSAEDTDTESAASISDDDERQTGMDGPSADMVRQALMARGPMIGMLHPDAPPSQVSSAAQSRQPSSTNVNARSSADDYVVPITQRGSIASSSAATIRPGDGNGVPSALSASSEVPSPSVSSSVHIASPPAEVEPVSSSLPATCTVPDLTAAQARHLKIGRDFRDGVGDLTGLSSRSPPVAASPIPSAKVGSLSATLSQSGCTPPQSFGSASARTQNSPGADVTTDNIAQLPVGAAPLAVPTQTILEGQRGMGPTDGTHVDALVQGMQATSVNDALAQPTNDLNYSS